MARVKWDQVFDGMTSISKEFGVIVTVHGDFERGYSGPSEFHAWKNDPSYCPVVIRGANALLAISNARKYFRKVTA